MESLKDTAHNAKGTPVSHNNFQTWYVIVGVERAAQRVKEVIKGDSETQHRMKAEGHMDAADRLADAGYGADSLQQMGAAATEKAKEIGKKVEHS